MYDKFCLIIEISNTFCRGAVVSELNFSVKVTIGDQEILKKKLHVKKFICILMSYQSHKCWYVSPLNCFIVLLPHA